MRRRSGFVLLEEPRGRLVAEARVERGDLGIRVPDHSDALLDDVSARDDEDDDPWAVMLDGSSGRGSDERDDISWRNYRLSVVAQVDDDASRRSISRFHEG